MVNKSFRKEMTADFTVVGNSLDLSAVTDITSGTPTALKKNGNGFSLSLKAGGLAVLKFPQGYSVLPAADQKDGKNLLQDCGASVSSSAGDGRYAYMLNDGDRTTNFATAQEQTGWILYDLHTVCTFNRVDIYPASGQTVGFFFPKALSVWISEDGKEFKKVASYADIDVYNGAPSVWTLPRRATSGLILMILKKDSGKQSLKSAKLKSTWTTEKFPRWSFRRKKN